MRKNIKYVHRKIDGIVGNLFNEKQSIAKISVERKPKFILEPNNCLSYSRKDHFSLFHLLPIYASQNLTTCDLKVYQDLFIYSYLLDNIPKGAKILEIGGGDSRIIAALKNDFEFWNLDKLEGEGYGPKRISTKEDYTLVKDCIGNFSQKFPNNYFDLIFSISVVEHFSQDEKKISDIYLDINRLLKKGGVSLHCIDSLFFNDQIWIHPFISFLEPKLDNLNLKHLTNQIINDKNLWVLPKYSYYTRWFLKTRKPLKKFGLPFSVNLYWQN